ncbi:hypothetical protein ZTR_01739 [Talaromyces verruculosus]|nr:hypothetical protein ZTR_01739 [Talaromyces verruculosus]
MNPASLPFKTFEDELNAYISGLLSQQSSASASFAPSGPAAYNGFDGLTSAESSFCGDIPPDLTWDDYLLITENLLLEGTVSFDTLAGIAPGVSNLSTSGGPSTFNVAAGSADITTSGAPSTFTFGAGSTPVNMTIGSPTFNFGAESADINMPVGSSMPNLVAGNTGISMPGALPTFGFTAGSTNINMPVGSQMFDLSPEFTGIDVPVGLQTIIEHQSYLGYGNGGFPSGTNVGGFYGHWWLGWHKPASTPAYQWRTCTLGFAKYSLENLFVQNPVTEGAQCTASTANNAPTKRAQANPGSNAKFEYVFRNAVAAREKPVQFTIGTATT